VLYDLNIFDFILIDLNQIKGIAIIIATTLIIPFLINLFSHRRIGNTFCYFIIGLLILMIIGIDYLNKSTWIKI